VAAATAAVALAAGFAFLGILGGSFTPGSGIRRVAGGGKGSCFSGKKNRRLGLVNARGEGGSAISRPFDFVFRKRWRLYWKGPSRIPRMLIWAGTQRNGRPSKIQKPRYRGK
jgi:hypothetical protein